MPSWTLCCLLLVFWTHLTKTHANNCRFLSPNSTLPCACCTSGYGGFNCSEACPYCKTRVLSGNRCIHTCKDGYYGTTCNNLCSPNCIEGIRGVIVCEKGDGSCFNGCEHGYYGPRCTVKCNSNCHNRDCVQIDGGCNSCKEKRYYGRHCYIPCSCGCFNGTCKADGVCIGGCTYNYYGKKCTNRCRNNCRNHTCTENTQSLFNCTDGCTNGFTSSNCTVKCPKFCKECGQQTGHCYSCVENMVKTCDSGDCNNGPITCTPSATSSLWIWLATFSVLLLLAVMLFVLLYLYYRKRYCCQHTDNVPTVDSSG